MKYYAKLTFGLVLLIVFGIVSGCTDLSEDDIKSENNSGNPENSAEDRGDSQAEANADSQSDSQLAVQISTDELKKHSSKEDCWIAYKGDVYDITAFLPQHPGSAGSIAPYCGTSFQFENAFSGQHGTSKVNVLLEKGVFKGELTE